MIPLVSSRGRWVSLSRKLSKWAAAGLELDFVPKISHICTDSPPPNGYYVFHSSFRAWGYLIFPDGSGDLKILSGVYNQFDMIKVTKCTIRRQADGERSQVIWGCANTEGV